ncbi:MAG: aldo/keto reductase [Opitutaceae bacterium]|nr:aldo/keto reductase [Verrucomicrobiales bacterium]
MKSITLGSSTLKSSRIAYGCWRLAGPWTAANLAADVEERGKKAVLAAFDAGYTLFDLADVYSDGAAEIIFGKALKDNPEMRQRIVISNKCGVRKKGTPTADAPYRYDFSADYIVQSCENSLARTGDDVIDLYQLHRPDFLMNPEEVAGAFTRLKEAGKVREFGVSNFRPSQVTLLQKTCPMPLVVNQVEISLLKLDSFNDGTMDQCLSDKITPLAWSPLSAGRLADNTPVDMNLPDHARRSRLRDILEDIARAHSVTRPVIALAWLLKHPAGIVPIIGSTTVEKIQDCARAGDLDLTREEWYRLMEAGRGERLP